LKKGQSRETGTQDEDFILFYLLCSTPLSAIFQLYHGDQF
jgi:hypothetical protein